MSIACLGPKGSFSHEFALKHFSAATHLEMICGEGSFQEILATVEDGIREFGVIPFLNSKDLDLRPKGNHFLKSHMINIINVVHVAHRKISQNLNVLSGTTDKFIFI